MVISIFILIFLVLFGIISFCGIKLVLNRWKRKKEINNQINASLIEVRDQNAKDSVKYSIETNKIQSYNKQNNQFDQGIKSFIFELGSQNIKCGFNNFSNPNIKSIQYIDSRQTAHKNVFSSDLDQFNPNDKSQSQNTLKNSNFKVIYPLKSKLKDNDTISNIIKDQVTDQNKNLNLIIIETQRCGNNQLDDLNVNKINLMSKLFDKFSRIAFVDSNQVLLSIFKVKTALLVNLGDSINDVSIQSGGVIIPQTQKQSFCAGYTVLNYLFGNSQGSEPDQKFEMARSKFVNAVNETSDQNQSDINQAIYQERQRKLMFSNQDLNFNTYIQDSHNLYNLIKDLLSKKNNLDFFDEKLKIIVQGGSMNISKADGQFELMIKEILCSINCSITRLNIYFTHYEEVWNYVKQLDNNSKIEDLYISKEDIENNDEQLKKLKHCQINI